VDKEKEWKTVPLDIDAPPLSPGGTVTLGIPANARAEGGFRGDYMGFRDMGQ